MNKSQSGKQSGGQSGVTDTERPVRTGDGCRPPIAEAAKRALAEAKARRTARDAAIAEMPKEKGGRNGPEPVRYGDWESKGIASDF